MERCWSLSEVSRDSSSVLTVGSFDGVHRGHQAIIRFLVERAEARKGLATLVTFDPHPRSVVHNEAVPLLTTPGERADLCAALGVERFVVLPFDRNLAEMSPGDYVRSILVDQVGMQAMVIGHDHGYGKGRSGGPDQMGDLGSVHGFEVDIIPAQSVKDHVVSSSTVRRLLLEDGNVREAAALLGRPYRVSGRVIEGAKRGRTIGFPTANVLPGDKRKLVPSIGVYAVQVSIEGKPGVTYGAMMNIGRRPTFEGDGVHLEAHVLDFSGNLYDRVLNVDFVERLRPERRFPSIEALVQQLREDEARCRAQLGALP